MKIGVIIPDRGDRPRFLENCLRMLNKQTLKPDVIELVNNDMLTFDGDGYHVEKNKDCDITWRYRTGYERLKNKGLDCILLWENDDWYHSAYIETMVREWKKAGKPEIFGTNYTIYYHIKLFAHFVMHHTTRSSAMSTLLKPDLNFTWCKDYEPYTDLHLWKTLKGVTFQPEKNICMGIKHGEGLCGGRCHIDRLEKFINKDPAKDFLRSNMDEESFNFYTTYF